MVREVAPPRGALCLQCRTALAPGEPCDLGADHVVVRLGDPKERGKALDHVWGPPHVRVKQAAAVGTSSGAAGGALEGCGACGDLGGIGGEIGGVIIAILIFAVVAIAIWWIARKILHAIRDHRNRLRPQGAIAIAPPRVAVVGEVVAAAGERAAWGVVMTHGDARGTDVMLRDGHSAGLTLRLDDGQVVEIPEGRARVEGDGDRRDGDALARWLDPEYRSPDPHAILAFERVEQVTIAVGDRVELLGELSSRPDPKAQLADYREAPPSILAPVGVPWLRKV